MAGEKNSTAQMSPEELQAAMSAIVAHETNAAPAAPAAPAGVAVEQPSLLIPAVGVDDQIAEAIAKQRQAELDQVASEKARRDAMNPVARQYEDIKGLLPTPMQPGVDYGAEALGGFLAGQAINSATKAAFPQHVPGTPENIAAEADTTGFKTAQEKHEQAQAQLKALEPVVQSHEQAVQEHANELQRMEARTQALQDAHEMAARDLHAAQVEQNMHKIRDPETELHEQMGPPPQQESAAPKPKEKDYYGRNDRRWTSSNETSAANAARNRQTTSTLESMGLNPDEAVAKAPGMSATKSGVLGPSDIVEPQLAQENAAHQAELAQREQQKRIITRQIAAAQAAADLNVQRAQEQQKAAADALKEHRAALKAHMSAAPAMPSAVERARQTALENEAEYNRLLAKTPNAAPQDNRFVNALRVVGNVGKRFVPMAGAAIAPYEAEQAYRDYQKGDYKRMAAHGLGTLGAIAQATGIPPVMGVGNIMQTPSALFAAYDALNYGNLTGPE